ncbi:unnamed protein product, partial [Laminaria digitata]
ALALWTSACLWQMSDGGLPIIVGVIALACGFVGVFTNRRFGHPTFFAPQNEQNQLKWSIPIPNNAAADEKNKNISSVQQRPPPQPRHTNLRLEGSAVAAAARVLDSSSSSSSSNAFADLPAAGVVEHIASFLSPADLVGVAPVCVDLSRMSACEVLWKAHCVRIFGTVDSVLGGPWRQAQRRQQQRCEQSQCSGAGGSNELADVARRRRGRGQQQQQLRQKLPSTQFRRNTSSSSSSSSSLNPAEALNGGEDAPVKKDQPRGSSRSSSSARTRDDSTPTSPSPPPHPCPCPSCSSSCSWKEAFF